MKNCCCGRLCSTCAKAQSYAVVQAAKGRFFILVPSYQFREITRNEQKKTVMYRTNNI
jgi:hypothetical protein